jgi:integrase
MSEIIPEDIGRWRDWGMKPKADGGLGLKPGSVLREMSLLHAVFALARTEWHWCRSNPISDTSKAGMRERKPKKAITDLQRDLVVQQLGYEEGRPPANKKQETAYAFLIALETGMRNGEILSLEIENLFLKRSYLHLDKTKNGDERDVALSRRAVQLIESVAEAWKQRRESGAESLRIFSVDSGSRDTLFRQAMKDAGVTGITFHRSRHTATRKMAKKLPVLALAKQIGHRDLKSLMVYYEADPSEVAALLD